ncbi:MAG: hypothetical protein QM749_19775 [Aquabacterium sp.]
MSATNLPQLLRRRRDWFTILRDLKKASISYHIVARKCGKAVGSVVHWAEGGDPKDADARIIMALYAQHCPEQFAAHQRLYEVTLPADGHAPNLPNGLKDADA